MVRIRRLRLIAPLALSLAAIAPASGAEVIVSGRPSIVLDSPSAKLVIDFGGGSIVDFHLANGGLNPLRWIGPAPPKPTPLVLFSYHFFKPKKRR